ncbi:MAG: MmgE/PrpD family protein [Candidatus Rokubacteria bacterium]|nr:MmgE/PrpD family protein [Candidatus Rokubacteria bacterium]
METGGALMPDLPLNSLARFLASMDETVIPPEVQSQAALVVLDTFGVILGGSRESEVDRLVRRVRDIAPDEKATLFARGFPKTGAVWASFINGTAGTFLELDEGHRPTGHPGIHVVPAAFALGETLAVSGKRFLSAVILGYDVAARLSAACRLRRGIHPHGTLGTVGAATACGKLLGFKKKEFGEVLSLSASLALASPTRACIEGATVRNSYAGVGAQLGIQAALLVDSGFTGLGGGLAETFGALIGSDFDPAPLADALGAPYAITQNYFKFHACCAYNHPALDAVGSIQARRPIDPEAVDRIEIRTIAPFAGIDQKHPTNQLAAKFSIPYAVAAALLYRTTGAEAFRDSAVRNPRVRHLADRVTVTADASLTARWPRESPTEVSIHLRGGEQVSGICTNPRGYYENPCSRGEIERKFLGLAEEVLAAAQAVEACATILSLGEAGDLNAVTRRLRALSAR